MCKVQIVMKKILRNTNMCTCVSHDISRTTEQSTTFNKHLNNLILCKIGLTLSKISNFKLIITNINDFVTKNRFFFSIQLKTNILFIFVSHSQLILYIELDIEKMSLKQKLYWLINSGYDSTAE